MTPIAALADKRVALVVGNSGYQNVPKLTNPSRDAKAVAEMFKAAKFDSVVVAVDVGNLEFKRAIRNFEDAAEDADIAVVYYAGHGIEINGTAFMIPTDAKLLAARDAKDEAIALDRVIDAVEPAKHLRLIIVDACRDNPFPVSRTRAASRQINTGITSEPPQASTNTLIAYAAKKGQTAEDGNAEHSPFATALLHNLTEPGLDVRIAFGRVRDEVLKLTDERQEPFVYGSIGGDNVSLVPAPPKPKEPPEEVVRKDYELIEKINSVKAWDAFIKQYPTGLFHDLAVIQHDKLVAQQQEAEAREAKEAQEAAESERERERQRADMERAWNKAKLAKTSDAFRDFISRYPLSPRVLEAQTRLDELEQAEKKAQEAKEAADRARDEERQRAEERNAWNKVRLSKNQDDIRKFIERYPASSLLQNAQAQLDALIQADKKAKEAAEAAEKAREEERQRAEERNAWNKVRLSKNQDDIRNFMNRYPLSPLVPAAQAQLDALIQADNKAAELAAKAREEERQRTEERNAWNNVRYSKNQNDIRGFIERYPSSPLVPIARAQLDALALAEKKLAEAAAAEEERKAEKQRAFEAKQKADLEAKQRAELEAKQKAEQQNRTAVTLASLPRAPGASATPQPPQVANTPALVRSAQRELTRLGCYVGEADGKLSDATKTALIRYFAKQGRPGSQVVVTEALLEEFDQQQERACPLQCPAGQLANGDLCVANATPEAVPEQPKPTHGPAAEPAPRRPEQNNRAKTYTQPPPPPAHREARRPPVQIEAARFRPEPPVHVGNIGGGGGGGGGHAIGVGF